MKVRFLKTWIERGGECRRVDAGEEIELAKLAGDGDPDRTRDRFLRRGMIEIVESKKAAKPAKD